MISNFGGTNPGNWDELRCKHFNVVFVSFDHAGHEDEMKRKTYVIHSILILAATIMSSSTTSAHRHQQQPAPSTSPRQTRDAEANQTGAQSSTKKLPFDPRNLSGVWWVRQRTNFTLSSDPPPMTPWALEKYNAAKPGLSRRGQPLGNDPIMICDPMGYPRILFWNGYPDEIIQTPDRMIIFFDWFYTYRTIWTDGRKLDKNPEPRWYGNSVGHWEGDTLVVESNGFDERAWLDADGHPHSEDMMLEERFRRVDHDTIELNMTLTDPRAYAKPWVAERKTLVLDPQMQLREDVCVPSDEQKYKELIREPAAGAGSNK